MKIRSVITILLLLAAFSVKAQLYSAYPYSGYLFSPTLSSLTPVSHFGLQTGASFTGTGSGGSLFSTWVAPSFNQPVGKNFTLTAGAFINNTRFNNISVLNQEGNLSRTSTNLTTFTIYGAGSYRVNDRLTVSGSAFKTINPAFNARLNADNLQMEAQGMSVGVGYKVSENFHIGAEFRMQQSNSNLYNPFFSIPGSNMGSGLYGF